MTPAISFPGIRAVITVAVLLTPAGPVTASETTPLTQLENCAKIASAGGRTDCYDVMDMTGASGDLADDINACRAISRDVSRLACLDTIVSKLGKGDLLVPEATPDPARKTLPSSSDRHGKWLVRSRTDPINDSQDVTIVLISDSGVSSFRSPIALVAICSNNSTELYVDWEDYLAYSGGHGVTLRLDDDPPRQERWTLSSSGTAVFTPYWAGELLREMLNHDRLAIRTGRYSYADNTAVFDIRGLRGALRPLAEACNWTFE